MRISAAVISALILASPASARDFYPYLTVPLNLSAREKQELLRDEDRFERECRAQTGSGRHGLRELKCLLKKYSSKDYKAKHPHRFVLVAPDHFF